MTPINLSNLASNPTPSWIIHWANWLIEQYQLSDEQQVYDLITQVMEQLSQGNSVYFTSHIEALKSACQLQQDYLQEIDLSIKNTKFIQQIIAKPATPFIYDGQALSLYRYWSWEMQLAWQLKRLSQQHINHDIDLSPFDDMLNPLDQHQINAIKSAIQHQLSLITGGPGTGKTFTLAQIIAILLKLNPDLRIAMAAPTGKAAQRMQEALQNAIKSLPQHIKNDKLNQLQPMTLHRLLGMGTSQKAKYHLKNPLPYDIVVVDEASMLDLNMAHLLCNALHSDTRLILLGDAHQLASVDVGSVLADMQNVPDLKPYHQKLVHSRRFDDQSQIGKIAKFIIDDCQNINQQTQYNFVQQFEHIMPPSAFNLPNTMNEDFAQLCYFDDISQQTDFYINLIQGYEHYQQHIKHALPQLNNIMQRWINGDPDSQQLIQTLCDGFDSYRILTATQMGTFGVTQLNERIESALLQQLHQQQTNIHQIKKTVWYIGKAVMMTYNDYTLGLSNGDIGICLSQNHQQYGVFFPSLQKWFMASRLPQNIQPAFALTIHKSQGSEFLHTAVILHDDAERLLSQELIYTGITRAKKQLTLLCSRESLAKSLSQKTQRHSQLANKIALLDK